MAESFEYCSPDQAGVLSARRALIKLKVVIREIMESEITQ
jgi:hypothetical protein